MTNNGYEKIAYPETYTNEDELHNILKSMRENDPVCWLEPENYRPFGQLQNTLTYQILN